MMNFYSPIKMKKYIKRIKKINPQDKGTLLGLDIGRIYVGTAVSDRNLTKTLPLDTFRLTSGLQMAIYPQLKHEFDLNAEFFTSFGKLIEQHNVKGLIVGYPVEVVTLKNKQENKHGMFIENFIKHMCRNGIIQIPLTYVNEKFSTFQAAKLIELTQVKYGKISRKPENEKELKDKVAAAIILKKFLDYLDEDDDLVEENDMI